MSRAAHHRSGLVAVFVAGLCVTAAADGACAALTAVPPALLAAAGLALAYAAARERQRTALWPFALTGIAAGLALPSSPPQAAGAVVTRAPGQALRGDIFEVLARIDDDPARVIGRRVRVSGAWSPAAGDRLATVSRRVMSCCAADAVDVGFDVVLRRPQRIERGSWVRIEGIVQECIKDGDVRYLLEQSTAKSLEDQ